MLGFHPTSRLCSWLYWAFTQLLCFRPTTGLSPNYWGFTRLLSIGRNTTVSPNLQIDKVYSGTQGGRGMVEGQWWASYVENTNTVSCPNEFMNSRCTKFRTMLGMLAGVAWQAARHAHDNTGSLQLACINGAIAIMCTNAFNVDRAWAN